MLGSRWGIERAESRTHPKAANIVLKRGKMLQPEAIHIGLNEKLINRLYVGR